MNVHGGETGFTIIEVIVAIVIISLFAGLFFQTYLTNFSQQTAVIKRAAADDIATTNLKKVTARTSPLLSSITCDTSSTGNTNNLAIDPLAPGSSISFTTESLTGTSLPPSTTQTMVALYPRGCTPATLPMEIVSTVSYGTESVRHALYVN